MIWISYQHCETILFSMVWSVMQPITTDTSYTLLLVSLWVCGFTISFSTLIHACCMLLFLNSHLFHPGIPCDQSATVSSSDTWEVKHLMLCISRLISTCLGCMAVCTDGLFVCGLTCCTFVVLHSFNIQHAAKPCTICWALRYTCVYLSSALVVCPLLYRLLECLEKSP